MRSEATLQILCADISVRCGLRAGARRARLPAIASRAALVAAGGRRLEVVAEVGGRPPEPHLLVLRTAGGRFCRGLRPRIALGARQLQLRRVGRGAAGGHLTTALL